MDLLRLQPSEALAALETSAAEGLSQEEAERRLAREGPNTLVGPPQASLAAKLLEQCTHFLALLLWLAAVLAFLAEVLRPGEGMATLGWTIVGVIAVNAVFSFVQEYKAERALSALRRLLPHQAWVIRSGRMQQVARDVLVPGDLLLLEEGEQVPADARLISATGLRIDLSALTGEAIPKRRSLEPGEGATVLEQSHLVFAGTTVVSGRGRALVYATGMRTEFGKIAGLTTGVARTLSPLQREIAHVTHVIAALSLAMGLAFFTIGIWVGLGFWASSVLAVGMLVANVPEGLLPTVTLALAIGSQRMAQRRALIKHLTSVETLGAATVICTDKTGTLTENRMRLERLYVNRVEVEARDGLLRVRGRTPSTVKPEEVAPLVEAMIHCNNAKRIRRPDGRLTVLGDPTEAALVEFAMEHGLFRGEPSPRLKELPFDADRKRMSTLHWREGGLVAYVKGAPETVLPLCRRVRSMGRAKS
ncbi:cation-translocating P-type ATPase [Candidatus Nitrospira bockiana]